MIMVSKVRKEVAPSPCVFVILLYLSAEGYDMPGGRPERRRGSQSEGGEGEAGNRRGIQSDFEVSCFKVKPKYQST